MSPSKVIVKSIMLLNSVIFLTACATAQDMKADQSASDKDSLEDTRQSVIDHASMQHEEMQHEHMDHASMDHKTMDQETMDHSSHSGMEDHSAHRAMIEKKYSSAKYQKNQQTYNIDDVSLLRMDNQPVKLADEISIDKPVILNFIFTSCATVCPVLTATFSQFQEKLGDEASAIKMISISIDPEYDTPLKLREYAEKFGARSQWQFYTGSLAQSVEAQRAFDAYRGSKMNHIPLTFLRAPGQAQWVRLEGFTSSNELMDEFRRLVNS